MRSKDPKMMEKIQAYIGEYYLAYNRTPSTAEISKGVKLCRSSVYKYLVEMDRKNMLDYRNGKVETESMRKILVDREPAAALGEIACGDPVMEEEVLLYKTTLPTAVFGKGPFYILYAKGDSMVDEGIEEGDILVIKKNAEPRVGNIVVALDENQENTLKMFGGLDRKNHKVILKYCNRAVYGDKVILADDMVCQGVLSHVIKQKL